MSVQHSFWDTQQLRFTHMLADVTQRNSFSHCMRPIVYAKCLNDCPNMVVNSTWRYPKILGDMFRR